MNNLKEESILFIVSPEYAEFYRKNNKFLDLPYMCYQSLYDNLIADINIFTPKNTFEDLGKYLLLTVLLPSWNNKYLYLINNISFGTVYQSNYSGRMANKNNKNRPKRGLFDFKIDVAHKLNTTHYQVFCEIALYSNLQNCKNIWAGISPKQITTNLNELIVLNKLMLMMFEQEVNWGDEPFQEFSAFPPSYNAEPRDMLMGFIDMMFRRGEYVSVENIPDWKSNELTGEKMTPIFGQKNKYKEYDKSLKIAHFNPYRGKANALMVGELRSLFLRASNLFKSNS